MRPIKVVAYDPAWPDLFARLRAPVWAVVQDYALSIEHVGSTSVPGLAAKPVIDISVVVKTDADVPRTIAALATLGYAHRGNLGIEGREAFRAPANLPPHHLYVCPAGSLALRNHIVLRDYLRAHPDVARQYGVLKKQLAAQFPDDIESYVAGKTAFIVRILRVSGFSPDQVASIAAANR
jgi:GrpB-like predicted nucleotidyltransferase (UPF0157 family)